MRVTTASSREHGHRGHALPSPNHYLRRRRRAARAGSDGGGLARQRVFSSSFLVLFCFSAQTKEATEPKNIAHPKTRNHLKFTTNFFFSFLFYWSKKLQEFGTKKPNKEPCEIYTRFFF